jgi:hypothetical protein
LLRNSQELKEKMLKILKNLADSFLEACLLEMQPEVRYDDGAKLQHATMGRAAPHAAIAHAFGG